MDCRYVDIFSGLFLIELQVKFEKLLFDKVWCCTFVNIFPGLKIKTILPELKLRLADQCPQRSRVRLHRQSFFLPKALSNLNYSFEVAELIEFLLNHID